MKILKNNSSPKNIQKLIDKWVADKEYILRVIAWIIIVIQRDKKNERT